MESSLLKIVCNCSFNVYVVIETFFHSFRCPFAFTMEIFEGKRKKIFITKARPRKNNKEHVTQLKAHNT